ncbi:MAG: group II intron maturase-specific domain-containing protein, partial [Fuerstiella sp.]
VRGWTAYFCLEQRKTLFRELDKWLRRRIRACYWKWWRLPKTKVRKLLQLGVRRDVDRGLGGDQFGGSAGTSGWVAS